MEIRWSAPEFLHRERGVLWYWTTIGAAVLMIAFAVWQRNFLFGLFIVLAEVLVLVSGSKSARMVQFMLTDKGLTVDDKTFYPVSEFSGFSIRPEHESDEDWREIVLYLRKRLQPSVKVHVSSQEFAEIYENIAKVLSEEEWKASLLDAIQEFIGL